MFIFIESPLYIFFHNLTLHVHASLISCPLATPCVHAARSREEREGTGTGSPALAASMGRRTRRTRTTGRHVSEHWGEVGGGLQFARRVVYPCVSHSQSPTPGGSAPRICRPHRAREGGKRSEFIQVCCRSCRSQDFGPKNALSNLMDQIDTTS
jgi:hypothetical protein